jgi:cytochrome c
MVLRGLLVMAAIAVAAPAAAQGAPDGKRLYTARCAQCHWDPAKPGEQQRIGPGLRGIVGRPAAANPAFKRYSAALRQSKIVWTPANLDAYLANPRAKVPGTSMAYAGLRAPAERAAVIAYLRAPR